MNFETKFTEQDTSFESTFTNSDHSFNTTFSNIQIVNGGGSGTPTVKIGTANLLATKWEGGNNLYSQIVEIEGVTENSQVDLTPSVEQLLVFYEKDLTLVTENEEGVVTVYAIGQKPENDYTIQVTITEVRQ